MVHESAAIGYEQRSATYASARPSYHPQIVTWVAETIAGRRVVDLGAGTGISTAALADAGLDVVAVEPVEAMRARLRESLPGLDVLDGTAEAMPFDDHSVGAVVVAQAFHWFDHGPALDEIARVLEPTGALVALWNVRDENVPWMAAYTAIQDREQGDTPRYRTMVWRCAIEQDRRFDLNGERQVDNPRPSGPDHAVERFLSTSFIARLDSTRQAELTDEIRTLVAPLGPTFDFPYWTEAQIWRRSG